MLGHIALLLAKLTALTQIKFYRYKFKSSKNIIRANQNNQLFKVIYVKQNIKPVKIYICSLNSTFSIIYIAVVVLWIDTI